MFPGEWDEEQNSDHDFRMAGYGEQACAGQLVTLEVTEVTIG
jgi:hypothetical protein